MILPCSAISMKGRQTTCGPLFPGSGNTLRRPTSIGRLSKHNVSFYAPLNEFSRRRWNRHACGPPLSWYPMLTCRLTAVEDGARKPAMRNTHRGDFPGGGGPAGTGTACAEGDRPRAPGRASRQTGFTGGRLESGDPRNARLGLGTIKPDLNPASMEGIKRSVAQGNITEGFQQAAGEIFQAPE